METTTLKYPAQSSTIGFLRRRFDETIAALVPAASNGNQKAIDVLAMVAKDENQRALMVDRGQRFK